MLDPQYRESSIPETSAFGGLDGRFSVPVESGVLYKLDVHHRGYARRTVLDCRAGEGLVVKLFRGASIEGEVRRSSTKELIGRGHVVGFYDGDQMVEIRSPISDGRFDLQGLCPGKIVLFILPEDAERRRLAFDLAEGAHILHDVEVGRGIGVRGTVLEKGTGRPIRNADVSDVWSFDRASLSEADGRFELRGCSRASALDLYVRADGYARTEVRIDTSTGDVQDRIVELDHGLRVEGFVKGPEGDPIQGAYVAAAGSVYLAGIRQQKTDWVSCYSQEDGAFVLENLRPDLPHQLIVRKPSFGTLTRDLPAPSKERVIELGAVQLSASLGIWGRVVDSGGQPLSGMELQLEKGAMRVRSLSLDTLSLYTSELVSTTDSAGRFCFADLPAGDYQISASAKGDARGVTQNVGLNGPREVIELVLPEAAGLSGVVTDPEGALVPDVVVQIESRSGPDEAYAVTDASGGFRFVVVENREYQLSTYFMRHGRYEDGRRLATTTVSGLSSGSPVVVVLPWARQLVGRVSDAMGLPVVKADVVATGAEERLLASTQTDSEGRYSLWVPEDASVHVAVKQGIAGRVLAQCRFVRGRGKSVDLVLP